MTTEELELAFRAHATELRSFLHRQLRNPETAADLTQKTYLRLLDPRRWILLARSRDQSTSVIFRPSRTIEASNR